MFLLFLLNFNILSWFPWLNFYTEEFFLQLLISFFLIFFITAATLYYATIYMFCYILVLSIFLAYYNLEVLTGFLLVVEFTALFVIILFLLALNFDGKLIIAEKIVFFTVFGGLLIYLLFSFSFSKIDAIGFLNPSHYWDDYYSDLSDCIMNDIFGLYLSYYNFNGFLFVIFAILIFITTLSCVNLFKILRIKTQEHLVSLQYVFDMFKDLINFEFLRKQYINKQTQHRANTRLVRSTKKNVTKK